MTKNNNIENNPDLKKNPYQVPAGYFENLELELQKIPKQETVLKPVYRKKNYKQFFAIAATFLLLISAGWYFSTLREKPTPSLTDEEIYSLVESGFISDNNYNLLESISIDELEDAAYANENAAYYLETTQPNIGEEIYLYTDY